tara:strand:- start:1149 stop:1367 length:219 start_codon:yes stop_codon:yes gene_type:complete
MRKIFDDADDVVRISLIKLWQLAPRWANKGIFEGYVYKLAIFAFVSNPHNLLLTLPIRIYSSIDNFFERRTL